MVNYETMTSKIERISMSDIKLKVSKDFDEMKQAHYWYGGEMAQFEAGHLTFHIEATGDTRGRLFKRCQSGDYENQIALVDIKDKRNQGVLGEALSHYIETDEELTQLLDDQHPQYYLELTDNNWWECFISERGSNYQDLMWCLDSTSLTDAIEEVFNVLKSGFEFEDQILQLVE